MHPIKTENKVVWSNTHSDQPYMVKLTSECLNICLWN